MIGLVDLNSLDGQIKTGTLDLYNTSRAVEPIDRLISTGAPYTWPADLVPTTTNVISLSWNRHSVNFRLKFTFGYYVKPDKIYKNMLYEATKLHDKGFTLKYYQENVRY